MLHPNYRVVAVIIMLLWEPAPWEGSAFAGDLGKLMRPCTNLTQSVSCLCAQLRWLLIGHVPGCPQSMTAFVRCITALSTWSSSLGHP